VKPKANQRQSKAFLTLTFSTIEKRTVKQRGKTKASPRSRLQLTEAPAETEARSDTENANVVVEMLKARLESGRIVLVSNVLSKRTLGTN
jgi:hypothetical protein